LLRFARNDRHKFSFSRRIRVRALPNHQAKNEASVFKLRLAFIKRGEWSADRRIHPLSAPHRQTLPLADASGAEAVPARTARLSALHDGACPGERTPGLSPGRASRGRADGCYPRLRPRLSGAPRAPVVMPAGTMPGPPGSGVTSPACRNRARSINRLSPVTSPR
jgi:hypothetical protein